MNFQSQSTGAIDEVREVGCHTAAEEGDALAKSVDNNTRNGITT